jgi:hypothetical protein
MEACRDLCLTAPYRCHSFDYGDTGERVCRLSHHTSTTLTQIQVGDQFGAFMTDGKLDGVRGQGNVTDLSDNDISRLEGVSSMQLCVAG